ncbi:unnamed protein product, partial [Didymodactylos carnosus]
VDDCTHIGSCQSAIDLTKLFLQNTTYYEKNQIRLLLKIEDEFKRTINSTMKNLLTTTTAQGCQNSFFSLIYDLAEMNLCLRRIQATMLDIHKEFIHSVEKAMELYNQLFDENSNGEFPSCITKSPLLRNSLHSNSSLVNSTVFSIVHHQT